MDHISVISDPRQAWKVEHSLTDIIFLMVTAVIAGAEGWEDIEDLVKITSSGCSNMATF